LDGFSESLRFELEPFGVHVKVVAPGGVMTDFAGRSLVATVETPDSPYAKTIDDMMTAFRSQASNFSTAEQIAEVIFEAATDGKPRLRYIAGPDAQQLLQAQAAMSEQEFHEMMKQNFGLA
jgi:short-subunit dehydrogenase